MFSRFASSAAAIAATGLIAATLALAPTNASAIPPEFTYQAQLVSSINNSPITSNNVTVTLRIYPSLVAVTPSATLSYPNLDLSQTGGYVNLSINQSSVNLNGDIFIEVTVDDLNDALPPENLSGRQKVSSVPFALNSDRLSGTTLAQVQDFAINEGLAAEANAMAFTTQALSNFSRIVFVNSSAFQNPVPDGTMTNPFNNIEDAYAYAKTFPGVGSFINRVVIHVMPGQHTITNTIEMDTVGIEIVGYARKAAVITGSADPLIRYTAPTSGAVLRDLQLRPNGATNRALEAIGGGRIDNVEFGRFSAGPGNTLVTINVPGTIGSGVSLSFRDFEVYGDVQVLSIGDQTTFTRGFITGTLNSTANVGPDLNEFMSILDVSAIGNLSVNPTIGGRLVLGNITAISGVSWNTNVGLTANNCGFVNPATLAPLTIPVPASGSILVNSFGNATGWTAAALPPASTGNVPGFFTVFLAQQ